MWVPESAREAVATGWAVVATALCAASFAELRGGHVSRAWRSLTSLRGAERCCSGGGGSAGGGPLSPKPSRAGFSADLSPEKGAGYGGGAMGGGMGEWSPAKRSKADPFDARGRSDYLSWDDYFMALAFLSAKRSKDPNKQVGACIVSKDRVILGIGYNGFPRGCPDTSFPWAKKSRSGDMLETKYPYVVHAEVNAILNKNHASLAGQTMFVTMYPCNECAKVIIQSQIDEVVVYQDKSQGTEVEPAYRASQKMLRAAGVKLRTHQPIFPGGRMTIDFPPLS